MNPAPSSRTRPGPLFLYRDALLQQESDEHNIAECIVGKNRHGETDTVKLSWDRLFTRFGNLELFKEETTRSVQAGEDDRGFVCKKAETVQRYHMLHQGDRVVAGGVRRRGFGRPPLLLCALRGAGWDLSVEGSATSTTACGGGERRGMRRSSGS